MAVEGAKVLTDQSGADATRTRKTDDLRELRRKLADAWWYEKPLETIEGLERRIAGLVRELNELG